MKTSFQVRHYFFFIVCLSFPLVEDRGPCRGHDDVYRVPLYMCHCSHRAKRANR